MLAVDASTPSMIFCARMSGTPCATQLLGDHLKLLSGGEGGGRIARLSIRVRAACRRWAAALPGGGEQREDVK